jgi:hypothetical protein
MRNSKRQSVETETCISIHSFIYMYDGRSNRRDRGDNSSIEGVPDSHATAPVVADALAVAGAVSM